MDCHLLNFLLLTDHFKLHLLVNMFFLNSYYYLDRIGLCHHGFFLVSDYSAMVKLFLYLESLRGFTQLFDDCRKGFRVDALLTQPHTDGQRLHVQTCVQQP